MRASANRTQDNESRAVANNVSCKREERQAVHIVDNSPHTKRIAQLQAMMDKSMNPHQVQLRKFREMIDNSPQRKKIVLPGVTQKKGPLDEDELQFKSKEAVQKKGPLDEEELQFKAKDTAQLAGPLDEEELQFKKDETVQCKGPLDEDELQFKAEEPVQKQENKTGLPDELKAGVENLSGMAMDDVRVHYNSSKPAQLNAYAYTQGTEIHVAPGQEKHLPHEAWHVVQQKQGRVQPTVQMAGGVAVNDDKGLEKEADGMGEAVQKKNLSIGLNYLLGAFPAVIQMGKKTGKKKPTVSVRKGGVRKSTASTKKGDKKMARPSFDTASKEAAFLTHNLSKDSKFTVDIKKPGLTRFNAAMPHRLAYKKIRDNTFRFIEEKKRGYKSVFNIWTGILLQAGEDKIKATNEEINTEKNKKRRNLLLFKLSLQEESQKKFSEARKALMQSPTETNGKSFVKVCNSFHANVPDLGPHLGVNNPVQDRTHLHLVERGTGAKRRRSPSPTSRAVSSMPKGYISPIAVDSKGAIITTTGETVPFTDLSKEHQDRITLHGTSVVKGFQNRFQFGPSPSKSSASPPPPKKIKKARIGRTRSRV